MGAFVVQGWRVRRTFCSGERVHGDRVRAVMGK
jgi:hypothetical protein